MAAVDLQTVAWLDSPAGHEVLASLEPYDPRRALQDGTRLRAAGLSPERAAAALTQARLRDRARDKLGSRAASMLFTQDGLEQATRAVIADRHAQRLLRYGARAVVDLGCGIGSDAVAMQSAGLAVHGVEADPVTAAIAAANLRATGRVAHVPPGTVTVGQAEAWDVSSAPETAVWLDPARRLSGESLPDGRTRRVFSLDDLSPDWQTVQRLAAQAPSAGIKLAPHFPSPQLPPGVHAEWLSLDGTAVECVLWWGEAAGPTAHTAVIGRTQPGGGVRWTEIGTSPRVSEKVQAPGAAYQEGAEPAPGDRIFEVDSAVALAGLTRTVAEAVQARVLDDTARYLLAPAGTDQHHPGARRWTVTEVLDPGEKALRRWVRDTAVGTLTVKKRGVETPPETLIKRLKPRGDREAILLLCRIAGKLTALEVSRDLPPDP